MSKVCTTESIGPVSVARKSQNPRGYGSGSGVDGHDKSGVTINQMREIISIDVSHILKEEFSGIVDRITGRLFAKF